MSLGVGSITIDADCPHLINTNTNSYVVSTIPPSPTFNGLQWVRSTDMSEFVYYDGFWIQTSQALKLDFSYKVNTPPKIASNGDIWIRKSDMSEFVFYDGFWIQINEIKEADIVATAVMSETPPASPAIGQEWVRTTDMVRFEWHDGFWVQINRAEELS